MLHDLIRIGGQRPLVALMPGLGPARRAFSRRSLRSLAGGLDEVRDVFSGRCSFSTSSISSSCSGAPDRCGSSR